MSAPLYLTAGVSPGMAVGDTVYINAGLAGKDFTLERVGVGIMYPDTAAGVVTPDYTVRGAGGFVLIIPGQTFGLNERFVLTVNSIAIIPTTGTPKYTNGFDITAVLSSLTKRLGWRQPTQAGSPVINSYNLTSKSGRYFQSFHSLVTINKLKEIIEDKDADDSQFNDYLTNLQTDAIMRCLNEVFREPELLEQKLMYTRFATMDQPVSNSGQFVGWIINVANEFSVSTQINTATLYFDSDCSFNLYLFMDGIKAPLQVIPVSCTAYARTVIEFESLVLNYKIGQKYYFGYFQSELGSARAVREQVETWATTRCFEAFTFTAPATDSNTDFNHNYRQYGMLPLGVNLEIISFRDHTQKILRKANLFDEAVGLTVAAMVIEEIVMTTRTNSVQGQTGEQASKLFTDLNQAYATDNLPLMPGIKSRIAGELKRLRQTFFPDPQAMSISQEDNNWLQGEGLWLRQNWRQITNPPIQVQ
jgi:hypothetical protein